MSMELQSATNEPLEVASNNENGSFWVSLRTRHAKPELTKHGVGGHPTSNRLTHSPSGVPGTSAWEPTPGTGRFPTRSPAGGRWGLFLTVICAASANHTALQDLRAQERCSPAPGSMPLLDLNTSGLKHDALTTRTIPQKRTASRRQARRSPAWRQGAPGLSQETLPAAGLCDWRGALTSAETAEGALWAWAQGPAARPKSIFCKKIRENLRLILTKRSSAKAVTPQRNFQWK